MGTAAAAAVGFSIKALLMLNNSTVTGNQASSTGIGGGISIKGR